MRKRPLSSVVATRPMAGMATNTPLSGRLPRLSYAVPSTRCIGADWAASTLVAVADIAANPASAAR